MRKTMVGRIGKRGEAVSVKTLISYILWAVFLIAVSYIIYYLVKRLTE